MKKYEVALSALLVCGACFAAQDTTLSQREVRDPRQLETYLEANSTDAETRIAAIEAGTINATLIVNNATVRTNATINGTTTLKGDVRLTATANANEIIITQTNATGQASTPLIALTDSRTGANADTADEASLVITAAGVYGLSVADGIVNIEGEIDSIGDITLDPAGNDVICDATVDATAYTADAAAGLDVKTAGALKLGVTTATSIDIGGSSVTAITLTTDSTGDTEIVLPAGSIGNAELASGIDSAKLLTGSSAGAIDISACTNLPTTGIVGGWSGIITNNGIDTTNTLTFANGVLTAVSSNP